MKIKPLPVLLVLIGLLGTSSDHNQLLVHGWRRTDNGLVIPDPQDLNTTAIENPVNILNSVTAEALNNGTDVKLFREGAQVIVRRYWYPYLVIGVQAQSPATTASTTPSLTPTNFTTQTITTLKTASAEMTTPAELLPSHASTAPYSTPEGRSTANLANPLSAAFLSLAAWIEEQLNIVYKAKFDKRYSHSKVNNLQKGSIKVNATLFFFDTMPDNMLLENTLISAWESDVTSLPLINNTVVAGQGDPSSSSPREALFSSVTLLLTCVLLISQTLSLI
ncbi:hypothetical protein PHYPO_G00163710 [Pangasianodon hypophthalmus]|uniref:SEA domain-containing protein n=1 Tax=Pangasianodon hypophthalmus TaxID=310915 RepID=A0A5N5JHI6_PANHP|nr:hypothetical protein PHYPO_G00163710 [Pangasianodon hypophthalmus]